MDTDSAEMHLCDLYARQLADAQMRAARRGQTAGSPPAYLVAPVFWSDTGNVFVFRPIWTIIVSEDEVEEYFYASPALNRLDGQCPYSAVRKFTNAELAKQFLAKENAYPRRPHYRVQDGDIVETYYRDLPGPSIQYPKLGHFDNGWDLVDGDGWHRYRYARPTLLRDMHIPSDDGFIGITEHLSSARSSLFFTFEGGIFLIEDDWHQHRQGQRK
jgi:hypothetical protein